VPKSDPGAAAARSLLMASNVAIGDKIFVVGNYSHRENGVNQQQRFHWQFEICGAS
jgi:hypothetical protein